MKGRTRRLEERLDALESDLRRISLQAFKTSRLNAMAIQKVNRDLRAIAEFLRPPEKGTPMSSTVHSAVSGILQQAELALAHPDTFDPLATQKILIDAALQPTPIAELNAMHAYETTAQLTTTISQLGALRGAVYGGDQSIIKLVATSALNSIPPLRG